MARLRTHYRWVPRRHTSHSDRHHPDVPASPERLAAATHILRSLR